MTTKIIYIANDGEEFETSQECLEYERSMDPSDCVLMFDEELNVLRDEDPGKNFEQSIYLYILNAEKAEKFFKWVDDNYGYSCPENPVNNRLYSFNIHTQKYDDFEEFVEDLLMKRRYLLKKVERLSKKEE